MKPVSEKTYGKTFVHIMQDPVAGSHLSSMNTYTALSSIYQREDSWDPSINEIMFRSGLSKKGVLAGIKILEETGWISVIRRGRGIRNKYAVHPKSIKSSPPVDTSKAVPQQGTTKQKSGIPADTIDGTPTDTSESESGTPMVYQKRYPKGIPYQGTTRYQEDDQDIYQEEPAPETCIPRNHSDLDRVLGQPQATEGPPLTSKHWPDAGEVQRVFEAAKQACRECNLDAGACYDPHAELSALERLAANHGILDADSAIKMIRTVVIGNHAKNGTPAPPWKAFAHYRPSPQGLIKLNSSGTPRIESVREYAGKLIDCPATRGFGDTAAYLILVGQEPQTDVERAWAAALPGNVREFPSTAWEKEKR